MSAVKRAIVVLGSGPGIGNHVGAAFAAHGFNHVILAARNEKRLAEDKAAVLSKTKNGKVKVDTLKVDLADLPALPKALETIESMAVPVEEIELDFRTTNLALWLVAQWAIPKLEALSKSDPAAKPSLLVTNSFLATDPLPILISLSMVKSAQRNMVMSLYQAFKDRGVHIGVISVGGAVADDAEVWNPANIAEMAWGWYEQEKDMWELSAP